MVDVRTFKYVKSADNRLVAPALSIHQGVETAPVRLYLSPYPVLGHPSDE